MDAFGATQVELVGTSTNADGIANLLVQRIAQKIYAALSAAAKLLFAAFISTQPTQPPRQAALSTIICQADQDISTRGRGSIEDYSASQEANAKRP